MQQERYLDPRHGPHNPSQGTPARRLNSVRRTSTVDSIRPSGLDAGLSLIGSARDLVTDSQGHAQVAGSAQMAVTLCYDGGAYVTAVNTDPPVEGVDALVGKAATTGFRAVIDSDTSAKRGTLEYLLLDEIPVSTLVSGYAVLHATSRGDLDEMVISRMRRPGPPLHGPDMCAGFQIGGAIETSLAAGRHAVVPGPEATEVVDPTDPLGWHEIGPLPHEAMRRWRRHDLWREGDLLRIDVFFRDSHLAPDGLETVIHEYLVSATVDEKSMIVVDCEADGRVLPFIECPQAVGSAGQVGGMSVSTLRPRVRADLQGKTTCTHLNDTLREIEDVLALAPLLA